MSAEGWYHDIVGTVQYDAPEVFFAAAAAERDEPSLVEYRAGPAEVYSAGITLLQLTTGRQPHVRVSRDDIDALFEFEEYHLNQVAALNRPTPL